MISATITPEGQVIVQDAPSNLEWMQQEVGGFIEVVWRTGDVCFIGDEDGNDKMLPPNVLATSLTMMTGDDRGIMLLGNILIVGEGIPDFTTLPGEWVAVLDRMAGYLGPAEGDLVLLEAHMNWVVAKVRDGKLDSVDTALDRHGAIRRAEKMLVAKGVEGRTWEQRSDGGFSLLND